MIPAKSHSSARGRVSSRLIAGAIVITLSLGAARSSLLHSQTVAADSLTAQLLAREKAGLDAIRRQDWAAYAAILAPNYQEVGLEGYHTRVQALAAIRQMRLARYVIEDVRTTLVTKDVAVIMYRGTLIGTFGGAPMQSAPFRYHDVWLRDGSVWRIVFSEETV